MLLSSDCGTWNVTYLTSKWSQFSKLNRWPQIPLVADTSKLLSVENQAGTVVSGTDNDFAIRSERSTQDGTMMAFVFSQKRARSRIPRAQRLVRRCRNEKVGFRWRMAEKSSDRLLQIEKRINELHGS